MKDSATIHQVTYGLSIRSEHPPLGSPVFRGTLETVAGQKFEFNTLAELNSLLCEIGGWIDTPPLTGERGEASASREAIDANRCDNRSSESDFAPTPPPPTAAPAASAPTPDASTEGAKSLVRRYVEEVLSGGRFEVLDELLSPNYKRYLASTASPLDPGAQKQRLAGLSAAFPHMQVAIDDLVAEGDRIAYRGTVRGTHLGAFQGIAPTAKQVTVTAMEIIRIENGKFVEHWGGPDTLSLLQQLGALG